MKRFILSPIPCILFSLFCFLSPVAEGSLFTERVACSVGDLVTVVIVESSYGKNQAQTRTNKTDDVFVSASQSGLSALIPTGIGSALSLGGKTNSKHDGKGKSWRRGELKGYVTAEVVEILENGNLKIKGEKKIHINQDDQILKLEGVIRPEDIEPGNQILSTYMADANIQYKGKGVVENGHRKGFFMRLLDYLF